MRPELPRRRRGGKTLENEVMVRTTVLPHRRNVPAAENISPGWAAFAQVVRMTGGTVTCYEEAV